MNGKMDVDWVIFILLFVFLFIGAIIYFIYCYTKPPKCAYCGSILEPYRSDVTHPTFVCPSCGAVMGSRVSFCSQCGKPMQSTDNGSLYSDVQFGTSPEYARRDSEYVVVNGPPANIDDKWVDYFEVKIDGNMIAEGMNGGEYRTKVYPGDHTINATVRWKYSAGGSKGEISHAETTAYLNQGNVISLSLTDGKAQIVVS